MATSFVGNNVFRPWKVLGAVIMKQAQMCTIDAIKCYNAMNAMTAWMLWQLECFDSLTALTALTAWML